MFVLDASVALAHTLGEPEFAAHRHVQALAGAANVCQSAATQMERAVQQSAAFGVAMRIGQDLP